MIFTLTFNNLNMSVQVGDVAYYSLVDNNQSGTNHPTASQNTKPYVLGLITQVDYINFIITVDTSLAGGCGPCSVLTGLSYYVFFQKHHQINTSGIIGYFMDAEYRNYSTLPAEIFATAVDYVESSK